MMHGYGIRHLMHMLVLWRRVAQTPSQVYYWTVGDSICKAAREEPNSENLILTSF